MENDDKYMIIINIKRGQPRIELGATPTRGEPAKPTPLEEGEERKGRKSGRRKKGRGREGGEKGARMGTDPLLDQFW